MEYQPAQRKNNKNHGGGNKHQNQRRYFNQNQPHNPNCGIQYQHRGNTPHLPYSTFATAPSSSYSPFLTYAQQKQPQRKANVGSGSKKKPPDDQELICSKCARYYQVNKQDHPIGFNLNGAHQLYQHTPPQQTHQIRLPYILPCDHTICGDCIRTAYAQRALKCPECDVCAAIDIDRPPDKSFAVNYYLVGRIYLLNHQSISNNNTSIMDMYNMSAGGEPRFVRSNLSTPVPQQYNSIQQQQQRSAYGSTQSLYLGSSRMSLQSGYATDDPNSLDMNEIATDAANHLLGPSCSMRSCTAPAVLNCVNCASVFCTACSKVLHGGEIAGLKDHVIRPVQPQLLSSCSKHPANVLDFHCIHCDIDLCCYCFIEDGHAAHEHVRLTKLNEDQTNEFKELILNVERQLKKLENTYKVTEQHITASKDYVNPSSGETKQHQQLVANVNKHFADLMAKVLNTHYRMRQKVDMAKHASVVTLRSIQTQVSQRLATGRSLVSQGRMVLESSDSSQTAGAIFNVAMLRQELEQMLQWPTCLVDGRKGDDKIGNVEFISDLSENLDKFCGIKVQDGDQFQLVHENSVPEGFIVAQSTVNVQHDFPDSSSQSSYSGNVSSIASTFRQSEFTRAVRPPSALSVSKMPPAKQNTNTIVSPIIGARYSVAVVHINSPESIYVQLSDNLPILKQIHNDLANYVKSLSTTEVIAPQNGECYIVRHNIHWVRARCIKPSKKPDFYMVQLLETGQTMDVLRLHMRESNSQFRHVPPMAYLCRLYDVYPIGKLWTIESKKLLENILSVKNGYISPFSPKYKNRGVESCNVTMQVVERHSGIYSVQLVASHDGTNTVLSDALMFTGHCTMTDSSNESFDVKAIQIEGNKIYDNTSKFDRKQRTRVCLVHVEDPYNIFVHLFNVVSHILELLRGMNSFYLENQGGIIYTPKKGMFVSVQCAENQNYNWYRGKIINVINGIGKVDVTLIDYGRTINVDYKSLRTLPNQFSVLECQAVHIRLADIAPPSDDVWPEASMEFLRTFVKNPGYHMEVALTAERTSTQQKCHTVALFECLHLVHYCINAQLVEAGLAKSTGKLSSADNIAWPQGDGNSSDDCRTPGFFDQHRATTAATGSNRSQRGGSTNSSHRLIEGTPSFTLDLMNTIQGTDASDMEFEVEDDDEEEDSGGKGRREVTVLLVKSPDEIYIKVKSHDPESLIIEQILVRKLQLHYGGGAAQSERHNIDSAWQKGDNIVAYNYETAQYHRCLIQQVLGEGKQGYVVICRDRAIEFKAEHSFIYPLHEDFIDVPYFSKRVRLSNIQPMNNKWPLFATDIVNNLCNLSNSDGPGSAGTLNNRKYYYRETGKSEFLENGEITQPGILWICTLKSCGPLERSRYQYRSVNKQLVSAGVAVSDTHNNPFIARRNNTPNSIPQQQESDTESTRTISLPPAAPSATEEQKTQAPPQQQNNSSALTPSHTAKAVMRAFSESNIEEAYLTPGNEETDRGGSSTSESDAGTLGILRRKKATSNTSSSSNKSSEKSFDEPIIPPLITSYTPAQPLPERRFTATVTYVDVNAHIYLHPDQLAPILITLSDNMQQAVRVYNQKVLLPNQSKRARTFKVGELCTVRFHMDKKWYRGKITYVIPCNTEEYGFEYQVQMVDYGNVEQVKPSELIDLVPCPTVPLIATRVRMHQLEPKCSPWNTSVLDTIHSLVVAKSLDIQICDKNNSLADVPDAILRLDGLNINDYLLGEFDCLCRGKDVVSSSNESDDDDVVIIEESESSSTTPVEEKSKVVFNFDNLELMPKLELGNKRTVKVIEVLNINVVSIVLVPDNAEYILGKYDEVFSSFNDSKIEHVPLKDIRTSVNCLARFSSDGLYYRAEIMSVLPSTTSSDTVSPSSTHGVSAHVFFIDYGNREIVPRAHLRSLSPYDPLVRRLPALARMVALHSVRLPDTSPLDDLNSQDLALDNMTELLQQKKFTMEIIRNEPKLSVNLLDPKTDQLVYESLISQGLIVYVSNDDSDDGYD